MKLDLKLGPLAFISEELIVGIDGLPGSSIRVGPIEGFRGYATLVV